MRGFDVGGLHWDVQFTNPTNRMLIDRTNRYRLATTDFNTMTVYLSNAIQGDMLPRVLIHEIGHCVIYAYGLIDEIHRMVKRQYWIEAEEFICNFVADYGLAIYDAAQSVLGKRALLLIPESLSKLVA